MATEFASQFVEVFERRRDLKISYLEEIAYPQSFINRDASLAAAEGYGTSEYERYLKGIAVNR